MAILSRKLMADVNREVRDAHGHGVRFLSPAGESLDRRDPFAAVRSVARRRNVALQASINMGSPQWVSIGTGLRTWVVGLEDRRSVLGGMAGLEFRPVYHDAGTDVTLESLAGLGMSGPAAEQVLRGRRPSWTDDQAQRVAESAQAIFYRLSGWHPELMQENRTRVLRQEQLNLAIDELRQKGERSLYAFEKERILLANIRAGDRNEARRILNEMLATIYLSSPQLVVLRARAIELMSCLTRAAIEDNPMLEPLIEKNHACTEALVHAGSFEDLSQVLMAALDDFIDGIYLHGMNRTNARVRKALDFIRAEHARRISLEDVARHIGLSASRTAHLVKSVTGRTVLRIIQEARVQHAQRLLTQSSLSSAEIAYEVGFGDQSYFTKHFRRQTGTTPARFRRVRGGL